MLLHSLSPLARSAPGKSITETKSTLYSKSSISARSFQSFYQAANNRPTTHNLPLRLTMSSKTPHTMPYTTSTSNPTSSNNLPQHTAAVRKLTGHFSDLRVGETRSEGGRIEELAEALQEKWSPNSTHQLRDERMT